MTLDCTYFAWEVEPPCAARAARKNAANRVMRWRIKRSAVQFCTVVEFRIVIILVSIAGADDSRGAA